MTTPSKRMFSSVQALLGSWFVGGSRVQQRRVFFPLQGARFLKGIEKTKTLLDGSTGQ